MRANIQSLFQRILKPDISPSVNILHCADNAHSDDRNETIDDSRKSLKITNRNNDDNSQLKYRMRMSAPDGI